MPGPRERLRHVKEAVGASAADDVLTSISDVIGSGVKKDKNYISSTLNAVEGGIGTPGQAKDRLEGAYDAVDENLTPGLAAGGAAAAGGAGYLAGDDKEASNTNRYLKRIEA